MQHVVWYNVYNSNWKQYAKQLSRIEVQIVLIKGCYGWNRQIRQVAVTYRALHEEKNVCT